MNLDGLYRMQGMLFSLMILGAFLKKKGIITDEGKRVIADLVIFVTLPCSIIESFEVELSMDILKSSAQALLVSCMVQVACYILNMVLYPGVGEEKKKVLKYATMASNAGILGNPVAEGIFGSMGLFYASFYLIPQRTAMWSLGMTYFTKLFLSHLSKYATVAWHHACNDSRIAPYIRQSVDRSQCRH